MNTHSIPFTLSISKCERACIRVSSACVCVWLCARVWVCVWVPVSVHALLVHKVLFYWIQLTRLTRTQISHTKHNQSKPSPPDQLRHPGAPQTELPEYRGSWGVQPSPTNSWWSHLTPWGVRERPGLYSSSIVGSWIAQPDLAKSCGAQIIVAEPT